MATQKKTADVDAREHSLEHVTHRAKVELAHIAIAHHRTKRRQAFKQHVGQIKQVSFGMLTSF